jgi:hypothetical protein
MKCDSCMAESKWLEILGKDMICHKCLQSNKMMGYILKTHMDTFHFLIKRLKIMSFPEYLRIAREDIEDKADLRKHGIILKKKF